MISKGPRTKPALFVFLIMKLIPVDECVCRVS